MRWDLAAAELRASRSRAHGKSHSGALCFCIQVIWVEVWRRVACSTFAPLTGQQRAAGLFAVETRTAFMYMVSDYLHAQAQ